MPRAGRLPKFEEVAAYLGLSETQKGLVAKARCASQLKMESSLGEEGAWSSEPVFELRGEPWKILDRSDERAEVLQRMERLDERERLVLSLRFGLAGEPPRTFQRDRPSPGRDPGMGPQDRTPGHEQAGCRDRPMLRPASPQSGRPRGRPRRPIPAQAMAAARSAG